jgi:hypothetical protein
MKGWRNKIVPLTRPETPSVGRIVHYVAFGTPGGEYAAGAHRAAVITDVVNGGPGIGVDSISLCVFNPTGLHFRDRVAQDEDRKQPGTWHFPERV